MSFSKKVGSRYNVTAADRKPTLKKAKFSIDGEHEFAAYDLTPILGKWNGFDSPGFTAEQANIALQAMKKDGLKFTFDKAKDAFVVTDSEGEAEDWSGEDYETVDGKIHLYAIGAWAWVWSKA